MATPPRLSKGDWVELTESVGMANAGDKGLVIQVFEDGMVMIATRGKRFSSPTRQTAVVEPSQLRPTTEP